MMKLLHRTTLKGLFALVFFLTTVVSWGQAFTITRGIGQTANNVTGITVNYTGDTSCPSGNANLDINMTITALAGYNVTITSIEGTGARSSAGRNLVNFQLINNGTVDGATVCMPQSSNCAGNSVIPTINVAAANQTILAGSTAKINVIRGICTNGNTPSGGGYTAIKTFIVKGVVTPANSALSDIIKDAGFTELQNIDPVPYQTTAAITTSNSVEVGSFTIRDGGSAANDSDTKTTTLSAISFTVANSTPLYRLAIFDGTTKVAETTTIGSTTSLSGFTLAAPDNGSKTFTLRAQFDATPTMTDNAQLRFTVSSVTAPATGSTFAATNGGAAATSITGDSNRLEVTASRLIFSTQPVTTAVNAAMSNVVVRAVDTVGNIDNDFTGANAIVSVTSTGTMENPLVTATATNGSATFSGLKHTIGANGLNLVASYVYDSWANYTNDMEGTSNAFNITKLAQTIGNFASNIVKTYGDAAFDLEATATSGLTVSYTSSDESVATISGNTVTILTNGSTTITAAQEGNGVYNAATSVPRTLTVNQKQLTVTGATAQTKIYDGNADATITGATLAGDIVPGDNVSLGSFYIAYFNNKNIGTAKPVEALFELEGDQASRYMLPDGGEVNLTADITAKELTITGITIADRNFDGTTAAEITGTPVLNGVVEIETIPEDVTLVTTGASAEFDNMGPADNIPVTVSGYTITGLDIANYTLTQPQGLTANIIDTGLADQTITFNEPAAVTYGDASFNLNATSTSGLTVTYTSSDENVATVSGNTVTITGAGTTTITALQAGDSTHNPAPPVEQQLVVNKKALTVNGVVAEKIYNGNTTADVSGSTLVGIVTGDEDAGEVVLTGNGTFADKNVNNGITATTSFSISGTRSDNYTLTQPGDLTGNIVPATLTLDSAVAANKVYDGTNAATLTGTLTGIVPGDTVTYNGTGTFATIDVATGIEVTSTSTLGGAQAGNYVLTQPTGLSADITLKNLTVTAIAVNKEYDRTTTAEITITDIIGEADGDDVQVIGGGTFNNFNVATGKPVTAALSLDGADAGNYTLTQPTGLTADITAKNLTVTSADVVNKAYDGTTAATIENAVLDGIVAGDEADVTIVSGTFAQAEIGDDIAVTNLVISGAAAGNYSLTQPEGLTGDITGMVVTLANATAQNKTYDGTTAATITGSLAGVAPGDDVTFTGTGTFASAGAANGIEVTPTITLGGTDADNYVFTQPTGLTANITPKALTVAATAANKEYDGTDSADITVNEIFGVIEGDVVTLSDITGEGTFNNKNVATGKPVTTALVLDAALTNYSLTQPTGVTADITARNITVDVMAASVADKTYDGTTAGAIITGAVITGTIEGDVIEATTGTFTSPLVAFDNNAVTPILSGVDGGNYTFTQEGVVTGQITQKELTVSGATVTPKVYDGNNTATIAGGTLVGVITADIPNVTLVRSGHFNPSGAPGDVTGEDVGTGKTVTSTSTLTGTAADNYSLTQPTTLTGNITQKALTIAGLTAEDKVYDKTAVAIVNGIEEAELVGIENSDDVSLSGTPVGTFNNVNVGTRNVAVSGLSLADDAANYTLTTPTLSAAITAKPLTLMGGAVTTKNYNNNTTATVTGTLTGTPDGVEAGDTVTLTGTFASPIAGTHNVTVALAGASAANYALTQPDPLLTGVINKAPLTITAVNKTKTVNTTNAALTLSYSTTPYNDSADPNDFIAPTLTTTAQTNSAVGAYPITFLTPGSAINYDITYVTGQYFITPVDVVVSSGTIWSNPITGSTIPQIVAYTDGQTVSAGITVSGISAGPGLGATSNTGNRYNAAGWDSTSLVVTADYYQFTITPASGNKLNLSSFTYTGQASGSGPGSTALRSSVDGYASNIGTTSIGGTTISLTGAAYQNLTSAVTFRLYAWGASGSGGTFSVNDFSFNGTVIQLPPAPVLPAISNVTSNVTTHTMSYGATGASAQFDVNATGTPEIAYSATFPAGVEGLASINASTGVITFNEGDDILPGTYNIPVNAKSYYNTVTTPPTNGDTRTLKLTVNKLNQNVTFDTTPNPLPENMQPGDTFTVEYSNAQAGLPVTFASSNEAVATVETDTETGITTVTIVGGGSANITASNDGDAIYSAYNGTAAAIEIRTISVTPNTLDILAYEGQASEVAQPDNITVVNLSPANGSLALAITEGAEYFEVSDTGNSNDYSAADTYAYTTASFNTNNPAIYVRLKSGLALGNDYTGTLTISGGGVITTVALNGTVQPLPAITTVEAPYGPFCGGAENVINVAYTTEGTFAPGNFYVQLSNNEGVFPATFTNIISEAGSNSPIAATLPGTLQAGNYRVRVVHHSNQSLLLASSNDNGSNILIEALPTLTAVAQTNTGCAGTVAQISLSGLRANEEVEIDYTIGADDANTTVTADAEGNASFEITLADDNNGQLLTITALTRTGGALACPTVFTVSTTLSVNANTWTGGAGTSDWNNANNWSCGTVPTEDTRAVIAAGQNQPEITGNANISVGTLIIENEADMIVRSGNNLTVVNQVNVVTGGSLTIENNANLIQVNDVDNSGIVTVHKNSAPIFRLDYAMWSSPVAGETLIGFSPMTLSNRFYQYNPLSDAYATIEGGTATFEEGEGYLIRVANNHVPFVEPTEGQPQPVGTPWSGFFTGTPNNGDVNVTVIPQAGEVQGFNAVGNPYPSPINVVEFFDANEGNLVEGSALYFWRKKNDSDTESYARVTKMAYTENSDNAWGDASGTAFDGAPSTWVINSGQGFIVQAASGTIHFDNDMREARNYNQQFRTAQDEMPSMSRLWLNLTGANGEFSQAAIGYTDETTLGIDYGWDGKAFVNDGSASLFSLAAEESLGIQARPAFDPADEVPMGYRIDAAGSFTITLDHMDGVFAQDQDIFLRDNLLDVTHNLKDSAYEFTSEAGMITGRFDVIYADELGTDNPEFNVNSIIVYKQESNINISSGNTDMTGVTVYDLRGRILYSNDSVNAAETVISGLQAQEQMLIIEVKTEKGKASKKIIF